MTVLHVLARDVIVSEAQAAEHNRSIVDARNALHGLKGGQIAEVNMERFCRHLRDAQMVFLSNPNRSLRWLLATLKVQGNI